MIGKQGTQVYHQETKCHKTPHLRKAQSKQKVVYCGTHILNPTKEGDGRRNQCQLTMSPAPITK